MEGEKGEKVPNRRSPFREKRRKVLGETRRKRKGRHRILMEINYKPI